MRKNICLEQEDLDTLKPFLVKHNGNFSAAVREVIHISAYITTGKLQIPKSSLRQLFDEFYSKIVLYTDKYEQTDKP